MQRWSLLVGSFVGLSACLNASQTPPTSLSIPEGCQPLLGGQDCLLPYPSDFFLVDDATTPTGARVELTDAAKLKVVQGPTDPRIYATDGASRFAVILGLLPDEVSPDGTVTIASPPEESTRLQSPTLLIEARTGQLIPHFVDLDPRASDPKRRAIVIHPLVALKPQTRYVVAIHNMRRPDGALAASAEGFALLRDQRSSETPSLDALSARFESEIFSVTDAIGLSRSELQLAWDFTTGSEELQIKDMLRTRQLALDALSQSEPVVHSVTSEDLVGDPFLCRIVRGEVDGPLFLDEDSPQGRLLRDANGDVIQNTTGVSNFTFTAIVPNSVCSDNAPGRVISFGHGFFGSQDEVESEKMRAIAERLNAVIVAIDWQGMSFADALVLAQNLAGNVGRTMTFTDGVHQGMANWLAMTHAIKNQLLQETALQRANNQPLYQTTPMNYLGISQGHILGGVMSALNPDLERVVLNVGGSNYTLMMFRAPPFANFLELLTRSLPDPLDQQKFAALIQENFERADPAAYAQFLLDEPLPGSPLDRRFLMQIGLGDRSVPNIGSFFHARQLRLPLVSPSPLPIFGLTERGTPIDGSAIALYDFGLDLIDLYRVADPTILESNEVHETVRRLEAVQAQMDAFYQVDSQILNTCLGVCDPE